MSYCKKLWNILFLSYLILINLGLTHNVILKCMEIKSNTSNPLENDSWKSDLTLLLLDCIIISLVLLPFILYTNILPVGNLANDGRLLGKEEIFYFDLNDSGKAKIVLNSKEKPCCKQHILRLLLMEMPPISYVLQVVAAYCYLIPKPFIDARLIYYEVPKENRIWHTDLDILFGPATRNAESSNIEPMTVAYFNFGFSLFLLSVQYSRVFWNVSRAFTLALFSVMLTFSIHMLIEYCLLSVMIKIAENPKMVYFPMRLELNNFTIIFLPILANIILLFSFTTVFHYGILQYGDVVVHRNRIIRRQMLQSYPHIVCSNQLDMAGPLSPCTSENRYLESSIEPVFSKSNLSHFLAICSIIASVIIKSPVVFSSIKHLYYSTASTLALVNMFISFFYLVSWLILWFAFALRRTWNFKIESNANSNTDQILLNGNILLNDVRHLQLGEMDNSFMLHPQTSQSNLSKQNMMTVDRSSNNYMVLQPMRNENMGFDVNNHGSMWRNSMYHSYPINNSNTQNPNTIYACDDHLNIRSTQLEDQLGSEHSYKSNWSRNLGFEILPPILPIFDENRYKQFNQNSAPIEKRVARYPRNSIFDLNEQMQSSILNNDLVDYTPTRTDMTYSLDNNLQRHNNRFKQTNLSSGQLRSPEKYCSLHGNAKGGLEQMDLLYGASDDDLQRSGFVSGDTSSHCSSHSTERLVKSPEISQTAGGWHQTESESMQSHIGSVSIDRVGTLNSLSNLFAASSGVKIGRVYDQQHQQNQ